MASLPDTTLQTVIATGEGQTVEFKDERVKPTDLAETLVAFANASGGTVLIGVADDRTITGVSDPKDVTDRVFIAASRECSDPPVLLDAVDPIVSGSRTTVIAVRVPPARSTVHSVQGRFLTRQGSRNVALSTAALRELLAARDGLGSFGDVAGRPTARGHRQTYEILRYQVTLALLDGVGNEAVLERRERVRFLQDNVITLYDHAWGDGQMFVGYRVSPGRVADRFRVGSRYRTLISLRETKNRGDLLSYRVRRRIVGGFTHDEEWLEVEVDHPTRDLSVAVTFPKERHCRSAWLVEASTNGQRPIPTRSTGVGDAKEKAVVGHW
jgi:hypothetical protein